MQSHTHPVKELEEHFTALTEEFPECDACLLIRVSSYICDILDDNPVLYDDAKFQAFLASLSAYRS